MGLFSSAVVGAIALLRLGFGSPFASIAQRNGMVPNIRSRSILMSGNPWSATVLETRWASR